MEPRRRVKQFFRALTAQVTDKDREKAASVLGPKLFPLFTAMTTWDQRHGLSVCERLQQLGFERRELLQAGLLHDCGKVAASVKLWHRVVAVLMKTFAPGVWWSDFWEAPGTWRYPFYVYREHPALGSKMAREAGCSMEVAGLILLHEDHQADPACCGSDGWLEALRAADIEG